MGYQSIILDGGIFSDNNTIVETMKNIYQIYSNTLSINSTARLLPVDEKSNVYLNALENGLCGSVNYKFHKYNWFGDYSDGGDTMIVCFSGGKDSTALAKKLIDDGKKIILFHVHGINKSYSSEVEHAKEIAKYLGAQIVIHNLKLIGKTDFLENPTKNQLVCSLALLFALKNGCSHTIAFGDFTTDTQKTSLFDRNWSDSKENWEAFKSYVRYYIKDFDVYMPFNTYKDSFEIISKDFYLLNKVQSCILPDRFREMTKKKNESKYNIKLLDNRCGSCWKCCVEWMMLVNKGIIEYNKDFYNHCLQFIKNKQKDEFPNLNEISIKNAYELFMKSNFEDSLFYKREKN